MNPNDPSNRPIPIPPARPSNDSARDATVDIARSQIDQIFGTDGKPNRTLSHNNQPMINRNPITETSSAEPILAETRIQSTEIETSTTPHTIETQPSKPAESTEQAHRVQESHHQYHSAWQQYYQNYYSKYYIDAMEKQRQNFVTQQAAVKDNNQDDKIITQKEALQDLRGDLLSKISAGAKKVHKSRHFVPAMAAIVVILMAAFVQYNGLLFAQVSAFISPGSSTTQDIIIGTGADQTVGSDPRIIIPKINVNAPVVYGLDDLSESGSQEALRDGVIHYPISGASALPGQKGNTVLLGHSSSDFFKPGNYKFIFVQLNRLSTGDLFYLDYQSKRYTYRVYKTEIIRPDEVSKLAIGDAKPYATLITCDPPGTATNRLIIYAEQIAPDPSNSSETQNSEDLEATASDNIVGNPPTLFEQIFGN